MGPIFRQNLVLTASRIALIAATVTLSGCSGTGIFSNVENSNTRNLVLPDKQDIVGGAAYWGAKYEANRDDIPAAISFAKHLRMMGGAEQAVTLLKEVVMKAPDNPKVLAEYGKALTSVGRSADALAFFARSIILDGRDWTALSAYGVALDQTSSHKSAQDNYFKALDISPNNPAVQSNLAMSYVLSGQIAQGEAILRKLVARPDATAQMRQNLSMIATLKGNKAEAEQLARQDLSPNDTFNNLAVLRQMSVGNAAPPAQSPSPANSPSQKITAPALKPAPSTPISQSPLTGVPLSKPKDLNVLPVPTRPMAPINDETDQSQTSAKAAELSAPKPTAPATPVTSKRKPPVTMAPIADDATAEPKPTQPASKPANQATAPTALRQTLNTETLEDEPVEMANIIH